jgi:hypothetical protein
MYAYLNMNKSSQVWNGLHAWELGPSLRDFSDSNFNTFFCPMGYFKYPISKRKLLTPPIKQKSKAKFETKEPHHYITHF